MLDAQLLGFGKMVSNRTIPELALDLGSFHVWSHLKIQDIFRYLKKSIDALYHEHWFFFFFFYPKTSLPNSLNYIRSKYEFKHFIFSLFFFFHSHRLEPRSAWPICRSPTRFSLSGITCFLLSKCLPERMRKKMRILYFNPTSHQWMRQTW